MELHVNLVTVIIFFGFLTSAGLAIYSHLKGYLKGQKYFTLMMLSAAVYSFGGMIESAVTTIDEKVFWSQFEYIGVSFSTILLLQFVLSLVDSESRFFKISYYLYVIPITVLALVWTSNYHTLMWERFSWNPDGLNVLEYHHGPAFYVFAIYSLILIVISIAVLIRKISKFPKIVKKQIRILIAGCMIPLMMTILYLLDLSVAEGLDLTILSLPLLGVTFLIAIFRYGMFKVLPAVTGQLANLLKDSIIILDENDDIVFFNTSAARLLGMKETQFSFQKVNDIEWLNEIISKKCKEEVVIRVNDDPEKWIEVTCSDVRDDGDKFKGYLIYMHDITKRKHLETQSRNLVDELYISHENLIETSSQKDRIMSIIAHDLRTTFHQVNGFGAILNETLDDLKTDEIKEYLAYLLKASEHGYGILEELLIWAKTQKDNQLSSQQISVKETLNQIIASMAISLQNKDLVVTLTGNVDLQLNTDVNVLNHVLRNLLANAIKFSNKNSTITVNVEDYKDHSIIQITDTGIGIPESDLPKLFNTKIKYTRAGTNGESGSGIGLILCKEMIERNNGKLEVTSQEGSGSTFSVILYKNRTLQH